MPAPAKALKQAAMFQTFENQAERGATPERLKELRRLMAAAKLDAYLVPRADEFQGEYVPESAARLKFITGFTGSAGLAVIGKKAATLFADGRYTVQARAEVEPGLIEVSSVPRAKLGDWLAEHASRGQRIGFDPRLHTVAEVERLTAVLKPHGIKLVPTNRNLVDRVWGGTAGDEALAVCVAELRRALHEDSSAARLIGTVHRRGSRWPRRSCRCRPGRAW